MYLIKREEYLSFLNELLAINFSPAFTKLVKPMLRLASIKQNDNCRKFRAMHKKLLRIHNNYSLHKNQVVYRCNGAALSEQDNIKLPFVDCILDISRSGKAEKVVPCMLDTGSQISVCSYEMFIDLGGDPDKLDKSRTVAISSTTELKDDCILGVLRVDLYIMLQLKHKEPQFAQTFVNLMVGKRNLDIKNKIILGVDLLHRAHISIQSNGL